MQDPESFDRAVLDRLRTYGSAQFITRMIDLVLDTALKRIESAREGQRDGDLQAVEVAAHSLKSSAGIVGAHRLQALAEELERSAREGEMWLIPQAVDALESAFRDTAVCLRAERERFAE